MNWIELIWHVMSGACLALSSVYFMVWLQRREDLEHLSISMAAAAVAAMALMEPLALQAATPDEFAALARWFHVPAAVFVMAMVPFVRCRYGVGSVWLGAAAIALRLAALVANFTTGVNLNFMQVNALAPMSWLGVEVVVPQGVLNPWMALGSLSLLALTGFLIQGMWELWRGAPREDRGRASATLLSAVVFLLVAGAWSALVATGVWDLPFLVVPPFVGVVLALGFDLGAQLMRVPELSRSLARSESSRQVGETQLQLAGRAAQFGVWSWDCRDGDVHCSESALALLDLPPCEPVDRARLAESISAEHRASLLNGYDLALKGDGEFLNEFSLSLRSGGVRWIAAVGHLERDDCGEPVAVQGVLIDITRRREADERFRRVVEAAPMAILLVQGDGSITYANHHAEQVFGYLRHELCALVVDDLVPPAQRRRHGALRRDYAARAQSRTMASTREVLGRRKDGSEVAIEVNLSDMPTESGLQVLTIINDISARRLAEQEAGTRRNELAHLSRVALLAELSGSLAHELNQPLTAILSNAQAGARFLARNPPDLDEVRESLRNIVDSDKRAGEIIRRLRAMLRKDPPDFQRLDLNEVVADVLHILHSDLISRNVDVRLTLQPGLPATMGDRIQLQQVLLNVIMNGCDAMASGSGQPVLTIQTREIGAGRLSVDVMDGGRGIPQDDLERIFLPFVTSKSAGLGLGLAVCSTIVQTHEGRLWAENNDGPGATLHLELRTEAPPASA
ncbi:MAG: PAS domain S-box protein [Arenimonas sp.]|nr:PAS domain S-box protein [Arenimonas sp.]MBP6625803.1 PAS domain S-box protein [Arenimonas sp.]